MLFWRIVVVELSGTSDNKRTGFMKTELGGAWWRKPSQFVLVPTLEDGGAECEVASAAVVTEVDELGGACGAVDDYIAEAAFFAKLLATDGTDSTDQGKPCQPHHPWLNSALRPAAARWGQRVPPGPW
jgi:hypothetical protein